MKRCAVPGCVRTDNKGSKDYCGLHYARLRRLGTAGPVGYLRDPSLTTEQRIFSRLQESPNGCWLWQGALTTAGYGLVGDGSDLTYVHRWVYEFLVCEIPDGLVLDHLCCVSACANPSHLEPVTRAVNNERGGFETQGTRAAS